MVSQTLPLQLTQSRHPHGTQEILLSACLLYTSIGTTNSQKTATGIIFTRLYNRNTKAAADIRFDSTNAAIMEKTSTYGDAILMVDDILPYDDPVWAKQQKKTVNDVIRTYGDRTPKMRSEAYAKINNCLLYTSIAKILSFEIREPK